MADNTPQYGFRWVGNLYGMPYPKPIPCQVATGQNWNVVGDATNLNLNVGDPVTVTSSGVITLAGGSEFTAGNGQAIKGIVVGFGPVWNGTRMVPQTFLQSGVSWGTIQDRAPVVYVIPAEMGVWEVDCDEASTATTRAAYQLFVGENVDHILLPDDTALKAVPRLDISSHATTTAQWRILNISPSTLNQDFSGNYVKLLVQVNEGQAPMFTATGV